LILAGSLELEPADEEAQSVDVAKVKIHSKYNRITYDNDIAILELSEELDLDGYRVAAAKLPIYGQPISHKLIVSGWGKLKEDGPLSNALQFVRVMFINNKKCARAYKGFNKDVMFCAGFFKKGGKDSCQGDSGGPISQGKKLVGITSFGNGCARPRYPGVYTKVQYFVPWINQVAPMITAGEDQLQDQQTTTISPLAPNLSFSSWYFLVVKKSTIHLDRKGMSFSLQAN